MHDPRNKSLRLPPLRLASFVLALLFVPNLFSCSIDRAAKPNEAAALERYEFSRPLMGVQARIVLYHADPTIARHAAAAAFDRMDALEQVLSDYRQDSEVNRWFRRGRAPQTTMSDDLRSAISRSVELSRQTDGAFDITVGPITRLWRDARRTGTKPTDAAMEAARARVGYDKLKRVPAVGWVGTTGDMQLDFGGIGKGLAADEAMKVIRTHRCTIALIDIGGDVLLGDPPPARAGWSVEVRFAENDSKATIHALSNCAIATSADSEQFMMIDGERYSHIIDPRSAMPLINSTGVSVIARDGATADALASAISVLGLSGWKQIAHRFPGIRVFFQQPLSTSRE